MGAGGGFAQQKAANTSGGVAGGAGMGMGVVGGGAVG